MALAIKGTILAASVAVTCNPRDIVDGAKFIYQAAQAAQPHLAKGYACAKVEINKAYNQVGPLFSQASTKTQFLFQKIICQSEMAVASLKTELEAIHQRLVTPDENGVRLIDKIAKGALIGLLVALGGLTLLATLYVGKKVYDAISTVRKESRYNERKAEIDELRSDRADRYTRWARSRKKRQEQLRKNNPAAHDRLVKEGFYEAQEKKIAAIETAQESKIRAREDASLRAILPGVPTPATKPILPGVPTPATKPILPGVPTPLQYITVAI